MPADFAQELGTSFTITRGQKDCLWAMPPAVWAAVVVRLRGTSLLDQRSLTLRLRVTGYAHTLSISNQRALGIPPVLRQFAGIAHEVMLVGVDEKVESWSRERWNATSGPIADDTSEELARGAGL